MKYTIDRSIWRSGGFSSFHTGEGPTHLLNRLGYMCCLGMICEQNDIPKDDLIGLSCPADLNKDINNLVIKRRDSQLSYKAMKINDSMITTPQEKESLLKNLFLGEGIQLEFVGEYA